MTAGNQIATLLLGLIFLPFAASVRAEEKQTNDQISLADYYGFEALEVFKLADRSQGMVAGDVNHDGKTDLVLIDNSHSRLDLLIQRDPNSVTEDSDTRDVNELENARRFDHEKLAVDAEISSLTLGDFNGDGRTDIAALGKPDQLTIYFQSAENTPAWSKRHEVRLPDVNNSLWTMAGGDLNSDQLADIAVLGETTTYVLYQQKDRTLSTPKRLMNTSESLGLAQIADLDADGLNDLCYTAGPSNERVLCVRRQSPDHTLGPELQFDLSRPRSLSIGEVDGKPGRELLVVDSRTNRLKILQMRDADKDDEIAPRLIQYGFGDGGSDRDRDLATGDIDGDGLEDVVATAPSSAQILVYRQQKDGELGPAETFPSLLGITQVRVADVDGNSRAEVFVLSPKEKTLGICRYENGRLTFPEALATDGEPEAFEIVRPDAKQPPQIVCLTKEGSKSSSAETLQFKADGTTQEPQVQEIELPGTPQRLVAVDVDRNDRPDFLAFFSLGRLPVLLSGDDDLSVVKTTGGIQLGNVSSSELFVLPPNTDKNRGALIVARDGFARELALGEDGQWKVVDQFNATDSNTEIVGVAALNMNDEPGEEIVLVDRGIGRLRILQLKEALYEPWKEVEIGKFPFLGTRVADLNGDTKPDLILLGRGKFAVLYSGGAKIELSELADYESPLKKVFFADAAAGDLNADGQADVALIDVRSHFVELLAYDSQNGLRHATHFPVFEGKSFSDSGAPGMNPREALLVDVTGDNHRDLVLLTHDRVLVYPQQTANDSKSH
ncbi:FG-GAP repeat domain-containing protein [Thalassoroseus pseudoceratinae]|uniref:FG-GAP repeat domain-containing protein n=1 Tax=Thalassoroseus pseudoceratinae TaxID=2713176 RepID=UPI00141E2CDC|nr:VCBS repeat-containing protein [Thalassoroseus pseudoceratinae]